MNQEQSLHTHTIFSDGDDCPEEMIRAAIRLGMKKICFTDHSYTFFDESYCMPKDKIPSYREEIRRLKELYREQITVLLGIEQDYYSEEPVDGYEYVIGSVHYVRAAEDVYVPVDESIDIGADILTRTAEDYFAGDIYALLEEYFRTAADAVRKTSADLIGHFNVIAKCNTVHPFFDEAHPRYTAAWKRAADALLDTKKPFEINLSPVLRGIRKEPYPGEAMQAYIRGNGGDFVVTGDCHSVAELERFCTNC